MLGKKMALTAKELNDRSLIEGIARDFLGGTGESKDSIECAVIMIAAVFEGPDVAKIARVTGYPVESVSKVGARLQESGLWTNHGTYYQEWNHTTKIGIVKFIMDHYVARGVLRRNGKKMNGHYVYEAVKAGSMLVN